MPRTLMFRCHNSFVRPTKITEKNMDWNKHTYTVQDTRFYLERRGGYYRNTVGIARLTEA